MFPHKGRYLLTNNRFPVYILTVGSANGDRNNAAPVGGRQRRVLIGESTRVTCIIYTPAEFNYGSLTFLLLFEAVRGAVRGGSNLYCRADRVATMLRPTGNCILEHGSWPRRNFFFKPSGHSTTPRACVCARSVARVPQI